MNTGKRDAQEERRHKESVENTQVGAEGPRHQHPGTKAGCTVDEGRGGLPPVAQVKVRTRRGSRDRRQNQETQSIFAKSLAREDKVYATGAQRRGGWSMRLVGWALQGLEKEAD